jgi:hypothetical protein
MTTVLKACSRVDRRSILQLATLCLALSGCAVAPTGSSPMQLTRDTDKQMACVAVQWTPREEIANYCGRDPVYGLSNQACLMNGYTIVSRKPKDWNDEAAMISLGHELYHALGAKHD